MKKWIDETNGPLANGGTKYTKEALRKKLREISQQGWIDLSPQRKYKDGGPGNTLEDLLGIRENNIPIADYGEFELKTHRSNSNSLISLFRLEPKPRSKDLAIIPYLVKNYGWPIPKYGPDERSLRVDIDAESYAERGFIAKISDEQQRVELHFDSSKVPRNQEYQEWLSEIRKRVGLGDLSPIPYWTFDDLANQIRKKIRNMVYVTMDTADEAGRQRIRISKAVLLEGAELKPFLEAIASGKMQIEFSARTHHNHGTAFRTWERNWPALYSTSENLIDS